MLYRTLGKGEPLVLIHGLGQTHESWKLQEELSEHFQLFILTLRGHGASPITTNITLYHFAQDVFKMLDDNGIEAAHFCGLSLGGVVVQEIHKQNKARVKSMILANTTSYAPSMAVEMAVKNRTKALSMLSDENYIWDISFKALYKPTDNELNQAYNTFHINRETYITAASTLKGINYLPSLNKGTPIHIIASSDDEVTPYLYNAYVTKMYVPKAKLTVLNRTGHLSNIQKPEQFNQIVKDFIQ